MNIKRFSSRDADFTTRLDALLAFEAAQDETVDRTVAAILSDVKTRGDAAVLDYTRRFDRLDVHHPAELELPRSACQAALDSLPAAQRQALEFAAQRVRAYHEHQAASSWQYEEADGTLLGQKVTPLDRVGLYVPAGAAPWAGAVSGSRS